jgi:drug/metabolite transporter (DMT)-like permease
MKASAPAAMWRHVARYVVVTICRRVAYAVRVNWARRMRLVAAVLVAAGVYLIFAGGDQSVARGMLLGGLVYAIVSIVLERCGRR